MARINPFLSLFILSIGPLIALVSGSPHQQWPFHEEVSPLPLDVPGKNPLVFCSDPESYILEITYVDLVPNPPEAGKNLTINASGKVTQDIEDGAHVALSVKLALNYGGQIPLLTRDVDICELMANDDDIDAKCPVDKEKTIEISKTVSIPQTPSKGKYVIQVDAYTKDEEKITCMGAEITL